MESGSVKNLIAVLDTIIFLKKCALFASLKTSELRTLAGVCDECVFEPLDYIVREKEIGDAMYLIREGSVSVCKGSGGTEVELTRLGIGECFGEMSLFDAEVRSASVVAQTACTLLRISGTDLVDLLHDNPAIGIELLRVFVRRLRECNDRIESLSIHSGTTEVPAGQSLKRR